MKWNTRFPPTNDLLDQAGIRCNTIMKYDFISILWPCYMEGEE